MKDGFGKSIFVGLFALSLAGCDPVDTMDDANHKDRLFETHCPYGPLREADPGFEDFCKDFGPKRKVLIDKYNKQRSMEDLQWLKDHGEASQ